MNARRAANEFIQLVHINRHLANVSGGCSEDLIRRAEERLSVTFPPSYQEFLRQLGECDIAGEEFYGVWVRGDDDHTIHGAVWVTLETRRSSSMPHQLVSIMSDGMGGLYVLDTGSLDNLGEAPVLIWEPGGSTPGDLLEHISDSFGEFALMRAKRALAALRR